ncbi:MAG: thiamine diphosphokinase [Tissierellia bacterium]|nr:thiamine diphosphokinase [Tissierellia bacterium]
MSTIFTNYLKDIDAIIIGGGKIISYEDNREIFSVDVICVDRGVDYAFKNGIDFKIAVGDFDSCSEESISYIEFQKINTLKFDREKDYTDLELAINYVRDKNYKRVLLLGCTGTRLDHTLSNINLLAKHSDDKLNLLILDDNNLLQIVRKRIYLKKSELNISILPTHEDSIFSIYGSKWELNDHYIEYGSSLTISNEFKRDVEIEVKKGSILLFLSKD